MRAAPRVAIMLVLTALPLSGCLGVVEENYGFDLDAGYVNPGVFPGNYVAGNDGSTVLVSGPHGIPKQPNVVRLRSERPHYPGPDTVSTEQQVAITLAYWLPLNVSGPVPVIVDAGPYYEQGGLTIDRPTQSIPFLVRNFVPHGYAVAAVAIRGTGTSGGCVELMGPNEVADLDQAINWLATQEWSNGNVAMYGASYDGSTPWMVASTGNEHLKTIVPTAGLPDIFDLMFHNGSAETRGPIMHNVVYWPFGFDKNMVSDTIPEAARKDPTLAPVLSQIPPVGSANGRQDHQDRQNLLCPEAFEGAVMGPYSTAAGDRGAFSTYWQERNFRPRVLDNYKGSVFILHGLQDWNVDPHVVVPFNQQLRAAGLEVKEWYGQWGHAYPDSTCAQRAPRWLTAPCRNDFAEVLLHWFERYLKGNATIDLGPMIQVQDNRGYWRNADSFPPAGADWRELFLAPKKQLVLEKVPLSDGGTLMPPLGAGPSNMLEFSTDVLEQDLRISGQPQLRVEFEAQGAGGFLGAWLFDENQTGQVFERRWFRTPTGEPVTFTGEPPVIGHAQLDLRFRDGGETSKPVVPGQRALAQIEFEPMDVLVPAGHRLTLWLFQFAYPDHLPGLNPSPVKVFLGGDQTRLRLPSIDVDPETIFPVPGAHFPRREDFELMHTKKPAYSEVVPPLNEQAATSAACLDAWRTLPLASAYELYASRRAPLACGTP